MSEASRDGSISLWLRLLGFALVPLSVQVFYPPLGGALGILTPLPLAYGMRRRNIHEGLMAIVLVAFMTTIVQGAGPGLFFLVETIPLCLGIYWAVGSIRPPYITVTGSVGLVALSAFIALIIYGAVSGEGLVGVYGKTMEQMTALMGSVPGSAEIPFEERAYLEWLMGIWKSLIVGIWLSTLTLLFILYTTMIRGWLHTAGLIDRERVPYFSRWSLPFPFIGVFIGLAVLVLAGKGTLRIVALNALLPLGTLYGIQGVAVIGHLFNRWNISIFIRVLILAFFALQFPLVLMVGTALFGLFDTWFEFRHRFPVPEKPPPA